MVSSSSVSPWRFVELCCGPTSLSSGPRTSPITLTTSLHPLEPQRPMRSLLMRPFHACPSQLFSEPKTNTSNWVFHKPDSAFSRLFVFTRSTNSSLDTFAPVLPNLLYKRERVPGTSTDASVGAASCLLASFLCKHLKSKLPRGEQANTPQETSHTQAFTLQEKKNKILNRRGKENHGPQPSHTVRGTNYSV